MTKSPSEAPQSPHSEDREMHLVEHLTEARNRLIYIIVAVVSVFVLLLPFYDSVYTTFAYPVLSNLTGGQQMLAQDGIDIFLTPIKVCLFLAVLLTMPWTLYQIWRYCAPALFQHEKRLVKPLIISATLFFYLGVLFAYFVILPIMFRFFVGIELEGVAYMPDITKYMSISLTMFLAFGVVFEVPVATFILVMLGVLNPDTLTQKRPYIILIAFIIGMVLTPPDVISQTLLAVPLIIMFELGLWAAKRFVRQNQQES